MEEFKKVSIRPGVTILSVLKHLNYKPYYALAEFVDNAIDSYLKNEKELKQVEGRNYKLRIDIDFDINNQRITIKDNAAGIHSNDFQRAFKTAALPPDTTRLSEFGMGMKSAACWFSNQWQTKTTALSEKIERVVFFDISKIVEDKIEDLDIRKQPTKLNSHYTVITLFNIEKKMPIGRGLGKVKRHLASIYRDFFKREILDLFVNGQKLSYSTPKILNAPFYEDPNGDVINWKQNVEFDFGNDHNGNKLKAKGFTALMETMSVKDSGFALFRRGRVIERSADNDEGFRPSTLSGSLGSHRYKRLFGELHLEGFGVSHTKDGFQWDDNMDNFLDFLKEQLESEDSIPILKQADKYRVRESAKNYEKVSQNIVDNTIEKIQATISEDVDSIVSTSSEMVKEKPLKELKKSYFKKFLLNISNLDYMVHIELSYDETIDELIQVGDHLIPVKEEGVKNIGVRLSLIHPFMVKFAGDDQNIIEPILRLIVALGLSEMIVKISGLPISELRYNINELLSGSLSNP